MPEKPRRRKNKSKRKNNKNSSTDVNKNNIEESETLDESCSTSDATENTVNTINVADNQIEISGLPLISNTNEVEQLDLAQAAHHEDINEVISSTSQVIEDCASKIVIVSSELDQESIKEDLKTSEASPRIDEINSNIESKEKVDVKSNLSEECAIFKHSSSNVNVVNEKSDVVLQDYIVETPEQVGTIKTKRKLDSTKKSKSCDNDDSTTIVEITDDSSVHGEDQILSVANNSNVLISCEESDIEWENVHHLNLPETQPIQGILSSDTISLNIVHCDEIKSLSPLEEQSLRNYLQTLNLSTSTSNPIVGDIKREIEQIINREVKCRLRKKGLTEDIVSVRAGPMRSLAVIDEEGSGDSSKTSRRHSYLSDKKSDTEELEDEVFELKPTRSLRCSNISSMANSSNKGLIPQPCIRVDAKLKEPEISEARGDWSVKTVEKMTGAELVYLTDSSSSTSSIYDLNDEADRGEETDVSVRMITPTIEVTDTESLLSNTFLSNKNDQNINTSLEQISEDITKIPKSLDNVVNNHSVESIPQHDSHEIVIVSTDNIKTDLIVKDINQNKSAAEFSERNQSKHEQKSEESFVSSSNCSKDTDIYDLEIKVLKCELNNAINNLIKEVISESENSKETLKETITRQDSSSSLDSSQCTAKYNPTHSSLNDVANILQEDTYDNINRENSQVDTESSHVKDVLQTVTSKSPVLNKKLEFACSKQPSKLRDLCVKRISSFPFGDKILEELAQVSLRLQNMSILASERSHLPLMSNSSQKETEQYELKKSMKYESSQSEQVPPPILPRKSSLKIAQDDPLKLIPTKIEARYECLSPSQKMLMERTNTVLEKDFRSQPNLSMNETTSKNRNENILHSSNIQSSIAPMKSETGSRLLSLLKDASISRNLNSQTLYDKDNEIQKRKLQSEKFSKRLIDEIESANQYKETTINKKSTSLMSSVNSFKPLPPPKPKNLSTYFYESDSGSNFRENSFRTMSSNKKYFHYSTGNLNKEIEEDISSIQNMHRYCTNLRDKHYESSPRRPSLPKDLCDQQMEYIRQKEKEVDAELRRLEQEQNKARNRGPRAPMISENKSNFNQIFNSQSKSYTHKDFTSPSQSYKNIGNNKLSSLFSSSQEELLREKMYSEYVNQMAEREQRKQQRVIKVTQTPGKDSCIISKSMPLLDNFDSKVNNPIEQEFISKARERWCKLGIRDPEPEAKNDSDVYREPKVIEHKIKVIEAGEEKDVQNLPSHMQEFVRFTVKDKEQDKSSTGESNAENASAHVVVLCAVIILVLTIGKIFLQLLRNK